MREELKLFIHFDQINDNNICALEYFISKVNGDGLSSEILKNVRSLLKLSEIYASSSNFQAVLNLSKDLNYSTQKKVTEKNIESFIEAIPKYKRINFIIIFKLNSDIFDYTKLVLLHFLIEKYNYLTICFSLVDIKSKKSNDELRYKLGQLLWCWKSKKSLSTKKLFYILDRKIDSSSKRKPIIKVSSLPSQNDLIPKRFSPIIEINEFNFKTLFKLSLKDFLSKAIHSRLNTNSDIKSLEKKIELLFPIEKDNINLANLFIRRIFNFLRISEFPDDILFSIFREFEHESLFTFYAFVCMFDEYILAKAGVKSRGAKYRRFAKLVNLSEIYSYAVLVKNYISGIREISENIIFHTEDKKGYLYFYIVSFDKCSILKKSAKRYYKYVEKYFKFFEKNENYKPDRFLEVILTDFNSNGIISTFKSNIEEDNILELDLEEKKLLDSIKLQDFFWGKFSKFPHFSHLDWRYLAQLGLKSFAKLVHDNCGLLKVETNNTENKLLFYFDKSKNTKANQLSYILNTDHLSGTSYYVLLPISEALVSDARTNRLIFAEKSLNELYDSLLYRKDKNFIPLEINLDSAPQHESVSLSEKKDYIVKMGEMILGFCSTPDVKIISFDYNQIRKHHIDISTFIKILAYVQLTKRFFKLIVHNLDSEAFNLILQRLNVLARAGKLWNNSTWLFLYDERGVPFIINGEDPEYCNYFNRRIALYYGYSYGLFSDMSSDKQYRIPFEQLIPYELLVKTEKDIVEQTIFEKSVSGICDNKITDIKLGVKIQNAHMRLGSKTHIDHFYEAESLFLNNFYVERFSYLIAKDISEIECDKNRELILVGYGDYSEMLLSKIKKFINLNYIRSKNKLYCGNYIFCVDFDTIRWENFDKIEHTKLLNDYYFAIIVPIGSTLTTNYKILKSLERVIEDKFDIKRYRLRNRLVFNASVLTIRDRLKKNPTEIEKFFHWKEIDLVNKKIITDYFSNGIHFYVWKEAIWNLPKTCPQCFHHFEDSYFSDPKKHEFPLLETNKSSIIPKLIQDGL